MKNHPIATALALAEKVHSGQRWKESSVPFIYHPLGVASLVLFFGGDMAQAQAAILHDTLTEGKSCEEISREFGVEVGDLVRAFQDPPEVKQGEWEWAQIKKAYLNKLQSLPQRALFTCICEELHEITILNLELKTKEQIVLKRYPVPGRDIGWYFKSVLSIAYNRLAEEKYQPLVSEFATQTKTLSQRVFEGVPN